MAWYPMLGRYGPANLALPDVEFGDDELDVLVHRPEPEGWKTRDGRVILLKDMTDAHLYNALRMVWRNRKEVHSKLHAEWARRGHPPEQWRG
jgi:hypothetical protein